MKEFYTIGEVSKIFNVPTSTLRYYDSISLISPWEIGENGYRYYSKAQFEIISTVVLLRSMGTSVKKLLVILNENNADGIRSELIKYTHKIDEEIKNLEKLKKKAIQLDHDIKENCYEEKICLETISDYYLMMKDFGDKDELDIDEILNASKKVSEWARTASIISTITKENLYTGNFHEYEKYGYMSETMFPEKNAYTEKYSSRLCVCANMKVSSVEHFEADNVYTAMLKFIKENNLTITGPAIERNILDLYCGNLKNPTMFFKIYIPVSKQKA